MNPLLGLGIYFAVVLVVLAIGAIQARAQERRYREIETPKGHKRVGH